MNRATSSGGGEFEVLELEYEFRDRGDFEMAAASTRSEILRSSRDYVRWLQSALNKLLAARLTVDGVLGARSRAALRTFQRNAGLSGDGIPGPRTEQALMAAGAGRPPTASGNLATGSGATSSGSGTTSWDIWAASSGSRATSSGNSATSSGAASVPTPASSAPVIAGSTPASGEFITIRSGVKLTPEVERVVRELDAEFRAANLRVTLTSGLRTPDDQLRIIRNEAIKRGVHLKYPAIQTATVDDVESWLGAWDELLNRIGFIVNPPRDARSRITGKSYRPSPHTRGEAFDLSGADLNQIANVVRGYCRRGGTISQILLEPKNNAVHVGVGPNREC